MTDHCQSCRFDRESGQYRTDDGSECKRDEYGDPTHHCTARRTCSQHVGAGELTCARCVGRTRTDLRQITERAVELPEEAEEVGVESEALNLVGPAADYATFVKRRAIDRAWIHAHIHQAARDWCSEEGCPQRHFKNSKGDRWHKRGLEHALADLIADDDEEHPHMVLGRWAMMLAEDYGYDLPRPLTLTAAAAYLDRNLHRVAQDDGQDFGLLARELRRCRTHLEAVLRDSRAPERGAPCPECAKRDIFVRLVREYGHWCTAEDCEQIHFLDDSGDIWRCPVKGEHWWNPAGYAEVLRERAS